MATFNGRNCYLSLSDLLYYNWVVIVSAMFEVFFFFFWNRLNPNLNNSKARRSINNIIMNLVSRVNGSTIVSIVWLFILHLGLYRLSWKCTLPLCIYCPVTEKSIAPLFHFGFLWVETKRVCCRQWFHYTAHQISFHKVECNVASYKTTQGLFK